jgi:hypothetical protein
MSKPAAKNKVLQFRTGERLGAKIDALANTWKVTPHEAARRLTILALYRLNLDDYPAIERLEQVTDGTQNFLRACDGIMVALDACDFQRRQRLEPPMNEAERVEFLESWTREYVAGGHRRPGEPNVASAEESEKKDHSDEQPYRKIRRPHSAKGQAEGGSEPAE